MLLFYLSLIESEEDKSKFTQLYNTYKKRMLNYAIKFMGTDTDAEDIVAETFIRIINHIDSVEEVDSSKTENYVLNILKHICIDFQREGSRKKHISFDEELEISYSPNEIINYDLSKVEFKELQEQIKELPYRYYIVLKLKFVFGYEDKEIAQMLNLKTPSVRKRVERARNMLEFYLADWFK